MKLIECKNVNVEYDGKTALSDVNMVVESGDYLCVLGENGSGKSTLMKALLGLKKVSSGTIKYTNIAPNQIGYLPQQTQIQRDFPATVYEVVVSGCLNSSSWRPFYTASQKSFAKANMEKLGISDLAKKSYRELSGGQQQRVLLARALCATQKMLLLDEPVTGLDPVAQAEFYDIIKQLNERHKITIIMITHDISSALEYSSKILHLNNKVEFFGTRDEYFETSMCAKMAGGAQK